MVTWDNTVLQETVGGEAIADSNMSFPQETQLDLLLFSVTLLCRMKRSLTFVLDCFSCNFILFFNTYDFSITPIVREAYVTLIRFTSTEKKRKFSYNNDVGEGVSVLKRWKKKQCAISTCK